MENPLDRLELVDPDLAAEVHALLQDKSGAVSFRELTLLVEETLWGLSLDVTLGEEIARGYGRLIGGTAPDRLDRYRAVTRNLGQRGPAVAQVVAIHLVPVLQHGEDPLVERFLDTVQALQAKGTYLLRGPLEALSGFLKAGEIETGAGFLDLLYDTFTQDLPYKTSLHLSLFLPKAVGSLTPAKRPWQMDQIRRVIQRNALLADPLMTGMDKGLALLSESALSDFVDAGLERYDRDREMGVRFFSLESSIAVDFFEARLVTVSLAEIRSTLHRYLKARTGAPVSIRSLSDLPRAALPQKEHRPWVLSDGQSIFLPDDITRFENRAANRDLYKCLVRLEAAYYEFGAFHFDSERAAHRCGFCLLPGPEDRRPEPERFFAVFPDPVLAVDLFSLFEEGRVRMLLNRAYPGIIGNAFPLLAREADRMESDTPAPHPLWPLYRRIALGETVPDRSPAAEIIARRFDEQISPDDPVEACAQLVFQCYAEASALAGCCGPLITPYGRKLRPDLFFAAFRGYDRAARRLKARLADQGADVYTADVRRRLMERQGALSPEDLEEIVFSREEAGLRGAPPAGAALDIDLSGIDLSEILGRSATAAPEETEAEGSVFRYREWDHQLGDYIPDHVRVREAPAPEIRSDFYADTLARRHGLVSRIRRAFELLKPEALTILRRWPEGDEFDYRALLDYAVDKKAGLIPSDRIYIKRIKQHRDVAAMLLVDLSRSTANTVFGSRFSVLDLEKEALVLFCEALQVVGDAFALAGFSGTGRLGVDFYRIKDFDEPVDETVQARITGLRPFRSTRTGAAVRHAAARLAPVPARVKLLIILGDGFPNDIDYKREYAVADTRQAIAEARAMGIHARAITVNIVGDAKLDALYGNLHHNVISDVRELPDKLLRIYSALTR
ncbi:MAG: nitric oxide reductase activation protein NorD [Thermodesulfobacteriota bacterium]